MARRILHRGLTNCNFKQVFRLADHVKVAGARLENGLLSVDLVREIPEEMKPRHIAITSPGDAATGKASGTDRPGYQAAPQSRLILTSTLRSRPRPDAGGHRLRRMEMTDLYRLFNVNLPDLALEHWRLPDVRDNSGLPPNDKRIFEADALRHLLALFPPSGGSSVKSMRPLRPKGAKCRRRYPTVPAAPRQSAAEAGPV